MAQDLIYTTRREFLAGTLGTLSLSATLPGFLVRTARAVAEDRRRDERILVVLQLAGGNDGLNTIVPYGMDGYYRARPGIAIPREECLRIDDQLGLHPALGGLKQLYDDGRLAMVQGVGYPNPNRSHFKSMDIWETGDPAGREHSGWLGRYFDNCCPGTTSPEPRSGIALVPETPLALQGERFAPLVFENEEQLRWRSRNAPESARKVFEKLNAGPAGDDGGGRKRRHNEALDFLRRAALEARLGAEEIREAARGQTAEGGKVRDRTGRGGQQGGRNLLQAQLGLVLRMIAADFPTTIYYVSLGGFDTHANQPGRHAALLRQMGDAVVWFAERLKEDKLNDRVLLMSFSEFGRRVQQNSSGGTDHGTAAPIFVMGSGVQPGLHLPHPSFERLEDGDFIFGCDFRRVYAAVLKDWLGTDPGRILRGSFDPLPLIRV